MNSHLTIFLLSGRPDAITKAAHETASWLSVDVRPFEEKTITSATNVRQQLRSAGSLVVAFGCKDLDLQRFQVALKFYLLAYGEGERYLLDESGRIVPVTWGRFLFIDVVRFALEIVASGFVLLHAAIRLSALKRKTEGRG